jgi:hypothetical protein
MNRFTSVYYPYRCGSAKLTNGRTFSVLSGPLTVALRCSAPSEPVAVLWHSREFRATKSAGMALPEGPPARFCTDR